MPPQQFSFFPIKTHIEYPKSKASADALGEVDGEDGHRYYVKTDSNGTPTRACEWLSTHIAESVGIAAPTPAIIEMASGNIIFGSRRIGGTAEDVDTRMYLLQPSQSNLGLPPSIGLRYILSSIYAFDMFFFNDDRHFGNYISYDDNGTRRLHAFDFSRSLFWRWPWNGFPDPTQNTRVCGGILRMFHGFDHTAATSTLSRIGALAPEVIEGFINRMPPDWLQADLRGQFLNWWRGQARVERVQELGERIE